MVYLMFSNGDDNLMNLSEYFIKSIIPSFVNYLLDNFLWSATLGLAAIYVHVLEFI